MSTAQPTLPSAALSTALSDPSRADLPVPARWLLLAAAFSLPLALSAPLGLAVFGFMAFGVMHNLAELRYVLGRYAVGRAGLRGALVVGLPLLAVILVRLAGGAFVEPAVGKQIEIGLVYATLTLVVALRPGPLALRLPLLGLIAGASWLSLSWPRTHFLVLAHLHNVMPAIFLILHRKENRGRVVAATLLWAVAVPALLMGGVFDAWLPTGALGAVGPLDTPRALFGAWVPQGWSDISAIRIVATFSFLQGMHYAIWIGLLPSVSTAPAGGRFGWFYGRPMTVLALAGTAIFLPFYLTRYMDAFSAYGALASFHVLVEFPVLLAFLIDKTRPA